VGLVIGKGGDMIKKIQTESGAKVQFKPGEMCFVFTVAVDKPILSLGLVEMWTKITLKHVNAPTVLYSNTLVLKTSCTAVATNRE
jgi:polyribonucleotide nucleotidyltransferase